MQLELTSDELNVIKFVFKNAIQGLKQLKEITVQHNPGEVGSVHQTLLSIEKVYDEKIKNE